MGSLRDWLASWIDPEGWAYRDSLFRTEDVITLGIPLGQGAFDSKVFETAAALLVAWHSPTLTPSGATIESGGREKDGCVTIFLNPLGGPNQLWDQMVVSLAPVTMRDMLWQMDQPDREKEEGQLLREIAAQLQAAGNPPPPWPRNLADHERTDGDSAEPRPGQTLKNAINVIVAQRRTIDILNAHWPELVELAQHLENHGDVDIAEAWKILGPRPVFYPLLDILDGMSHRLARRQADRKKFWRGLLDLPRGANTSLW